MFVYRLTVLIFFLYPVPTQRSDVIGNYCVWKYTVMIKIFLNFFSESELDKDISHLAYSNSCM